MHTFVPVNSYNKFYEINGFVVFDLVQLRRALELANDSYSCSCLCQFIGCIPFE